jgi:hypothetical protein
MALTTNYTSLCNILSTATWVTSRPRPSVLSEHHAYPLRSTISCSPTTRIYQKYPEIPAINHYQPWNINLRIRTYTTVFIKLWSAAIRRRFWNKKRCKTCTRHWTNEKYSRTFCDKTASFGWSRTESRPISSFHNLLYFKNYFIKHFKLVYGKNVVMVTSTTGIMFVLFFARTFVCGEFYEGGPRVRLPPMKWSEMAISLRNCYTRS